MDSKGNWGGGGEGKHSLARISAGVQTTEPGFIHCLTFNSLSMYYIGLVVGEMKESSV